MPTPSNDPFSRLDEWSQKGNDMPALSPVDHKITIRGKHLTGIGDFGHTDKAGVSEADRLIAIFSQEAEYIRAVFLHNKICSYDSAFDEPKNRFGIDIL
jgi:hypothetical protein